MEKFLLREKILGYLTNAEATARATEPYLVAGSQNVLIDPRFGKFGSRGGYSLLGAINAALTPVRQAFTWYTSTGHERSVRFYDDEMEVYLGTIGGQVVNAWTRIVASLSTTAIPRVSTWWNTTENLDILLFVLNDDNIYDWSGGAFTISSVDSGTLLTKKGTNTWAQDRIRTSGNKTLYCQRTDTNYTYTAGETTTQLTINDTTGLVAGDILTQTVVTNTDKPAANRINNYIFTHENQIYLGSDTDNEIYISSNTSYTTFTFSSPRVPGEGALLSLDGPTKGFGALSKIPVIFSGNNSLFTAEYEQITVSTTLAETLKIKKLKIGSNQGAYNQETIVPIGDALIYLTNEPALRMLESVAQSDQPLMKALSNPIKPDFDDETWTNAFAVWHKNRYHLSSSTSKVYILDYTENSDGTINRFWHPPQLLPVRAMSVINGALYGHSNAVAETYLLFNGASDGVYADIDPADKLPINAIAKLAYRSFGDKALLKNHDEFYVEGNISPSTNDLTLTLRYDFGGHTQEIVKTIDSTNQDILLESLEATSLGQQPLGQQPLGGSVQEPPELARFRVIFEIPHEDYNELQEIYETNGVDKAWEIIAAGPNAKISNRRNTVNRL